MATFSPRNDATILDDVVDPEGDPLAIMQVNGSAALIGVPLALSVGGSVTVSADGTVIFDDTNFTWPVSGNSIGDSFIATVSDGTNNIDVTVNLQLHVA